MDTDEQGNKGIGNSREKLFDEHAHARMLNGEGVEDSSDEEEKHDSPVEETPDDDIIHDKSQEAEDRARFEAQKKPPQNDDLIYDRPDYKDIPKDFVKSQKFKEDATEQFKGKNWDKVGKYLQRL